MRMPILIVVAAGLLGCATPEDNTVAEQREGQLVCTIEAGTGTRIPSKQCKLADVRDNETRVAREVLDSLRPAPLKRDP